MRFRINLTFNKVPANFLLGIVDGILSINRIGDETGDML